MIKNISLALLFLSTLLFAQFGENKVQYKNHTWYFVRTEHFDIYFDQNGFKIADFAVKAAEDALSSIEKDLQYKIQNRIPIILYDSHNDFQETNTTSGFLGQGTGGFTEPFKNRVVFPFDGNYRQYRHVIHHELVHAVMNDMIFGGKLQNALSRNITLNLPIWYNEGMAEFLSSTWETNSDMFIRDAIINEYLPDVNRLNGYFAYRGGESFFYFIAKTYGREKVGEMLRKIKDVGNYKEGIKRTLGSNLKEINSKWKKFLKKEYWPEIDERDDPEDFSRRLTDNKKVGGYYNTSPAISPQGDKIVFISDRDIYFDIYIMDAIEGKKVKRLLETGTSIDFEELNILFPSISWSPDNVHIALSEKSNGYDRIVIINTDSKETKFLPFKMDGIGSVSWSSDGNKIAFSGKTSSQSDIYYYDLPSDSLVRVTNDVFSDEEPRWAPDNKTIYFSSDRKGILTTSDDSLGNNFRIVNFDYHHLDLYAININSRKMERITNSEYGDELSPVVAPDGKNIIFVSDKNGIFNLYRKRVVLLPQDSVKSVVDLPEEPLTNSLNEINQLTLSADGKKLVFTSYFNSGYNLFMILNPFEKPSLKSIPNTKFMNEVLAGDFHSADYNAVYDSLSQAYSGKVLADTTHIQNKSLEEIAEKVDTSATTDSLQTNEKEGSGVVIFSGKFAGDDESEDNSGEYSRFIFGQDSVITIDSTQKKYLLKTFVQSLDSNGNYAVHKYKVSFSTDLVNANMDYSTLYGLLGYTSLIFSDMLGDHIIMGQLGMQIDLKNSDYGFAYFYLPKRIDLGFQIFHTARFLYVSNPYGIYMTRFQNLTVTATFSYPFNRFYRLSGGFSFMHLSAENLEDYRFPTQNEYYTVPVLSFVHDNTLWGYYSPIQGTRYRVDLTGNLGLLDKSKTFYSFIWDYRRYMRFWFDNSFVFRFSGGYSGGANPQRFMLGGTEGWLNRTWATQTIPLESPGDFAFLAPAMPMRGYNYAEELGTKYALLNMELRFPFIRYLVTGGLPFLFRNILGTAFLDFGTAWTNNKDLALYTRNSEGKKIFKDPLLGTGVGIRTYFVFMWRLDVAWSYDLQQWSKPRYYFSFGFDF